MNVSRPRLILGTTAFLLAAHAALWLVASRGPTHYPWPQDAHSIFNYWDAWHYSGIIADGYGPPARWAFFPLYPLVVRVIATITGLRSRPEIVGAAFSTLAFVAYCVEQSRLADSRDGRPGSQDERLGALRPETAWGWLFFVFWPATWAFHSHHTESLFLLLSFSAFLCSRRGRWRGAALLAGLCALTRNQGIFVAAAVALDSGLREAGWRRRALVFAASGAISFALFVWWPLYQYRAAGSPLMFVRAQWQFRPQINSLYQYFGTIWFVNPWQNQTWDMYLHHAAFVLMNAAGALLLRRREWALGLYVLLSLWGPLYQGHLDNEYRYAAVLFPALFALGDSAARLPALLRWALLACLLWLNFSCTWDYAAGRWAY